MTLPKWWPLAALAVIGALFLWVSHYEFTQGQYAQQLKDATRHEPALIRRIVINDTVFIRDTVRLTVVRHRTDSLLRVDTLIRADTVRQIVAAERAACDTVIQSCAARIQARDSLNANLRLQIKLLEKQHPSRFTCVLGGAATTKGIGLGGACGVRLF